MELDLKHKCAIVTAASQGLGYACAEALAQEGTRVVICSRSMQRITNAANEIAASTGSEVAGFVADLRDPNNIERLVAETRGRFGKIDILVFNHGNPPPGSFSDIGLEQWQEGVSLCMWSAINLCSAIVPEMKKQRWGRIIFISSIFAKEPDPGYVVSSTMRGGLLGLAKCLARELAPYQITVNTVLPGYFDTPLVRGLAMQEGQRIGKDAAQILQEWAAMVPAGTLTKPEALGAYISFLCSEHASQVTGACAPIDGGLLKSLF